MRKCIHAGYDQLLVALAAALLLVSGGWTWSQQSDLVRLPPPPMADDPAGAAYSSPSLLPPATGRSVWPKPAPQSHGDGWVYEVFTPPVINYHAGAKSFTVTPPANLADGSDPFGLELLEVKQEPYRLQLVGYFGGPDDYLAAFVSPGQSETLLARPGRRFEQLGLTLKSFAVQKVQIAHTDGWPVYDVAGFAVLLDELTGEEVVLDTRGRKHSGAPLAVLKSRAGIAPVRTRREGDAFTEDSTTYRIERIQLDPPEVIVARRSPGLPFAESRMLRPVPPAGASAYPPVPATRFPPPGQSMAASNPRISVR
jgi:hypothetical protein